MTTLRLVALAAACGTAALLAACGTSAQPGRSAALPAVRSSLSAHAARGTFLHAPATGSGSLLYVMNEGADAADIYSYPGGAAAGTLGFLNEPSGACVDRSQAVWIVEAAVSKIALYPPGRKHAKRTLSIAGAQNLLDCAVDSTTGNLAVTDLGAPLGGGAVWVFTKAAGRPKKYENPNNIRYAYFCGYDASGNLFVDGISNAGTFRLVELPSGGDSLHKVSLDGTVGFPGALRWDGKYLAVGDQAYEGGRHSAIYQVAVSNYAATVEGTTLLGDSCDVLGFTIAPAGSNGPSQGTAVIAPDACENVVYFYAYPAGGTPTQTLTGFQFPSAAVITPAGAEAAEGPR